MEIIIEMIMFVSAVLVFALMFLVGFIIPDRDKYDQTWIF